MYLCYVLTGKMTPWIERLIPYISNPLPNEDPKSYSNHYSAGGKELVDHNIEQKAQNEPKQAVPCTTIERRGKHFPNNAKLNHPP
jgi:hypothetical protein